MVVAEHLKLADEMFEESLRIIEDDTEWKLGTSREGVGTIFTNKTLRRKIIYKMKAVIDAPSIVLFDDMIEHCTESPSWNTTLQSVKKVATLDDRTDVLYNVVKELLGGAVSSRDFVLLRRWKDLPGGRKAVASVSIEHPDCPRTRENVRGENGSGITLMSPLHQEGREMTEFLWMLDSDPKGWLPQRIVDQAMFSAMSDFVASLKKHAVTLAPQMFVNNVYPDLETEEQFLSTCSSPVG